MKIVLDDNYFGGPEGLLRFVKQTLDEIERIEERGKKRSSAPDTFLGDCYPELNSIQVIFQGFLDRYNARLEGLQRNIEFNPEDKYN